MALQISGSEFVRNLEPLLPGETMQVPALDRYRRSFEDSPTFDASLWFVALGGDGVAAMSQLSVSPVTGRMNTGFTAVARAHRGQRLA